MVEEMVEETATETTAQLESRKGASSLFPSLEETIAMRSGLLRLLVLTIYSRHVDRGVCDILTVLFKTASTVYRASKASEGI
jgi:hypothetical protein